MSIETRPYEKKVVTFGGGTGHFTLLRGLVRLNKSELITAVPGTWDSGGSSGRLRDELGTLPPGDARQCLVALMENEEQVKVAQALFNDRLAEVNGPMQGHSLGNLIFTRFDHIYHGMDRALEELSTLFRIQAKVVPVSLTNIQLVAKTQSGIEIEGEKDIDNRKKREDYTPEDRITRIFFDQPAEAHPSVIRAVAEADKIVFSSGDLYTSVVPHLLVDGISEAIINSPAQLYFVLNLMTKAGETDYYRASDHIAPFIDYLGERGRLDFIVANQNHLDPRVIAMYQNEGQTPVPIDHERCLELAPKAQIISRPLARYINTQHLLRHDPDRLALAILE